MFVPEGTHPILEPVESRLFRHYAWLFESKKLEALSETLSALDFLVSHSY